jgi:nucleotide-binding universal stress UspA family protein
MTEHSFFSGAGAQVILHPTDLSEASQLAFAHALRLATHNKAFLFLLHVCPDDTKPVPWHDYPSVRETLERWGLLEAGARRSDVAKKLGLGVDKVVGLDANVSDSIVGFLRERAVDMIVIATEGRTGVPRWIKPSIAEPVAQRANVPTLFVPQGARGCVSLEDGHVTLDNVLIPVDRKPRPDEAVARGVRALEAFGSESSTLTLLHVGEESTAPWPRLPDERRWKCSCVTRGGRPVEEILRTAEELSSDLIILVTEGSQGFLDALRGSTTQQIVRRAPCPVLAIPFDF